MRGNKKGEGKNSKKKINKRHPRAPQPADKHESRNNRYKKHRRKETGGYEMKRRRKRGERKKNKR